MRPDCRCQHPADAHEHYRPGTECGMCSCPRYQRWPAIGDLLWGLGAAIALWRRL